MEVKLKLSIANADGESFMGPGPLWLLQRIRELGSINMAARDMSMSYAKAHHILKRLEENLGRRILVKHRGGHDRGGAELTPFAERLIERYDRHRRIVKGFAEKEFSDLFRYIEEEDERKNPDGG